MEITNLQNILVIVASSITLLGIPLLLFIIHRLYRVQSQILSPFNFPDSEELIKSLTEDHSSLKCELEKKLKGLEQTTKGVMIDEIEFRLSELSKAKELYVKVKDHQEKHLTTLNENEELGESARRLSKMMAHANVRNARKLIGVIDDLVELENELRRRIND